MARLLIDKAGNGKKLMLRAVVVRRPKKEEGHLAKRMSNLIMVCACMRVCVRGCMPTAAVLEHGATQHHMGTA